MHTSPRPSPKVLFKKWEKGLCFSGMFLQGAARLRIALKAELRRQQCKWNRGRESRMRRSQPALAHAFQQVVLPHHVQREHARARAQPTLPFRMQERV